MKTEQFGSRFYLGRLRKEFTEFPLHYLQGKIELFTKRKKSTLIMFNFHGKEFGEVHFAYFYVRFGSKISRSLKSMLTRQKMNLPINSSWVCAYCVLFVIQVFFPFIVFMLFTCFYCYLAEFTVEEEPPETTKK